MRRNLLEVIDEIMLKVIPETEKQLILRLTNMRHIMLISKPESIYLRWDNCCDILTSEIGEPKEDWQKQVQKIFIGDINEKYFGL